MPTGLRLAEVSNANASERTNQRLASRQSRAMARMTPSRADLIAAAWSATSWQFPAGYTADDFTAAVTDWDFWPVVVGGELAGAIMVREHLMHVCIKPEYFKRWATPGLYRRVLKHWRKCGRLETKVHVDHAAGRAFVERFGFRLVGCQGLTQVYELR